MISKRTIARGERPKDIPSFMQLWADRVRKDFDISKRVYPTIVAWLPDDTQEVWTTTLHDGPHSGKLMFFDVLPELRKKRAVMALFLEDGWEYRRNGLIGDCIMMVGSNPSGSQKIQKVLEIKTDIWKGTAEIGDLKDAV